MTDEGLFGWALTGLPDHNNSGSPLRGVAVYRFFDVEGDLLYVGVAQSITQRWADHAASKPWFGDVHHMTVVWYSDLATAEAIEREAIPDERPRYNITHNVARRPEARRRRADQDTPEARRARAAYRKSVKDGAPLSERALGRMFGRSRTWGANRIREANARPQLAAATG